MMPKMTPDFSKMMLLRRQDTLNFFSGHKRSERTYLSTREAIAREVLSTPVSQSTIAIRSLIISECADLRVKITDLMKRRNAPLREIQEFDTAVSGIFEFYIKTSYSIEEPILNFLERRLYHSKDDYRAATSIRIESVDKADKLHSDVHSKYQSLTTLHNELKSAHGSMDLIKFYINAIKQFAAEIEDGFSWQPESSKRRLCARVFV